MKDKLERSRLQAPTTPLVRTLTKAATCFGVLLGMGLLSTGLRADTVILDPVPRAIVEGEIGLTGETFGYGYINTPGGSAQFASDGQFSTYVNAETTWYAYLYLYSFQNTSSASLRLYMSNLPALAEDEIKTLDLTMEAGRITGMVSVTGGSAELVTMQTYVNDNTISGNYTGSVQAVPPALPVQPVPALPDTRVSGTVRVLTDAGCSATFGLGNQYVDVEAGSNTTVEWDIDVSGYVCPEGATLEGTIILEGLDGLNNDAILTSAYIYASGPSSRGVSLSPDDMSYSFTDLVEGSYVLMSNLYFSAPYNFLRAENDYSSRIVLGQGDVITEDRSYGLGTAHGTLDVQGAWDLSMVNNAWVYANGEAGSYAADSIDLNTGGFDFVLRNGSNYLNRIYLSGYKYENNVSSSMNLTRYLYNDQLMTFDVDVNDRLALDDIVLESSTTDVVFELAQDDGLPPVTISGLSVSGSADDRDSNNSLVARTVIGAGFTPSFSTSSLPVEIFGLPGQYAMQATGYGSDGRQYRSPFEMILGAPNDTLPGTDVEVPIVDGDGEPVGSVTFDSVSEGGDTTISQTSLGPDWPGFKVVGTGAAQYFDISTTATFDGFVTVCFMYDDTNLQHEDLLTLGHYIESSVPAAYVDITSSLDTDGNVICGKTESFSIFAVFEPIIIDTDNDGVIDDDDNCPVTPNASQADFDMDGIGDACDADSDGDGITDAEDLCPGFYSTDNSDLDGDGIGNLCDSDLDGDQVLNTLDNCPLVTNASQIDFDGDLLGDSCDTDDDGDSFVDAEDTCPGTPLDALTDGQGCSSGQRFERVCPSSGVYRNHGQYVSCVAREADRQVALGLLSVRDQGAIVSTAAGTDIGKK